MLSDQRRSPDIVLVTPVMPGNSGYGLRMRAGLLLEALCRIGAVHLVVVPVLAQTPALDEPVDSRVVRVSVLELDPVPDARADLIARLKHQSLRDQVQALYPRPGLVTQATSAAAEALAELVGEATLLVVMRAYLAPFVDAVLHRDRRPTCVLDIDDVESTVRRQRSNVDEAHRYERLERYYLPRFDLVLTCSAADASDVARRYGVRPHVVPNAVRLPATTSTPAVDSEPALLFVANFSFRPNADAALWLCQQVLPHLPSTTVALVGRDPLPEVSALAQPRRVLVTGTVPDVQPFYEISRVAVVPLKLGGGTSVKLLEAFAHRRPVVATSVGARGLPVRDGEHLLVADTPDRFAAACASLVADPGRAGRLASAGHDLVRRSFTVDVVSSRLGELLTGAGNG